MTEGEQADAEDGDEEPAQHEEEEDFDELLDDGEDDLQFGNTIDKAEKKTRPGQQKKNKHKLLAKAEQFEEYLQGASEEDRKRILEKKSWKDALAKATGTKVKDNAALLKKSIKRDENKKKKSQAEWKERYAKVDADKQARQDKRKANIKARKDLYKAQKLAGKGGKKSAHHKKQAEKKAAKARPGFEGKKQGFLNPKGSGKKKG